MQTTEMRCLFGFDCAGGAVCFCLQPFICVQDVGAWIARRRDGENCTVYSSVVEIQDGRSKCCPRLPLQTQTMLHKSTSVTTNHTEGTSNAGVKQPCVFDHHDYVRFNKSGPQLFHHSALARRFMSPRSLAGVKAV